MFLLLSEKKFYISLNSLYHINVKQTNRHFVELTVHNSTHLHPQMTALRHGGRGGRQENSALTSVYAGFDYSQLLNKCRNYRSVLLKS